jgi:hypothetical protein
MIMWDTKDCKTCTVLVELFYSPRYPRVSLYQINPLPVQMVGFHFLCGFTMKRTELLNKDTVR